MRKIRIGNDIRLKLTLSANEQAGFDKLNIMDQSSVKQLRCYLINTSWNKPIDPNAPKPYKRVGFPEFYEPSSYNINNSGFPSYHMMPANVCNYNKFAPDFHSYHIWPGYRGFGIFPEHFHGCPWHGCFEKHYLCNRAFSPCEYPYHPNFVPVNVFGEPAEDHSHQNPFAPWYLADSQVLHEANALTCLFPAVQQKMCGTYKLVVVLTVFEQGWGRHNLRTYTIDKGDVFELVNDETGESGNIFMDVDDKGYKTSEIAENGISVSSDSYVIGANSKLAVGGRDAEGTDYNISCELVDGTTILYSPKNSTFPELKFESSNPDYVDVMPDGTLYAQDVQVEKDVTITIIDELRNTTSCEFVVTVKPLDAVIMGFDPADDINQMSPDSNSLLRYSVKTKTYVVPNPQDGYYLWIYSQRRIHYIKASRDGNELAAELSSGFRVPMTDAEIVDGYYCYRSISPILGDDVRIKIKFENDIE